MNIVNISTVKQRFPFHGPLSSEALSELVEQLVLDLTALAAELNTAVQPVINSLPGGSRVVAEADRTDAIDPAANGLDGSQLYLDLTASDVNDPLLYNQQAGRPNTIKEAMQYLLMRIEQLAQAV